MATNPYEGQDGYDRAWYDGFVAGQHNPTESGPTAPSAFPPWELDEEQLSYFQQVWLEGHLAGQETPVEADVEHQDHGGHSAASTAAHVAEGVTMLPSIYHRHWGVLAVEVFLAVMVPSGAPQWTEEQGDLFHWFAGACREYGWEEFFMPVVWGESETHPGWHGDAHSNFDSAKAEAEPYVKQGTAVSIARYNCGSPTEMELIPLAMG